MTTDVVDPGRQEHHLEIQLAVSRLLAAARTVDEAFGPLLETLCEGLSWQVGECWVVGPQDGLLHRSALWHSPQRRLLQFEAASVDRVFAPHEGVPGRVWASRRPLWVSDISRDENVPRGAAAERDGLHGCCAFPAASGDAMVAVLVFFGEDIGPEDRSARLLLESVGTQLAALIQRERLAAALDAGEKRQARSEALRTGQDRILERIAAGQPLEETLVDLVRLIEGQSPGMLGSILFLEPGGQRIRHGAAPSLPEPYVKSIDGARIGPAAGSCGTAMHRRELVVVRDIDTDPLWTDYRHLAAPHGLRACWSKPILTSQGDVLGSFAMYYREVRSPTPEERELIDTASHLAGIAIQSLRAQEALRRSEEEYRRFFEADLSGNYVATPDGRLLACNGAFARIFGFDSVDDALATGLAPLFPSRSAQQALIEPLRVHQRIEGLQHRLRRKGGTAVFVQENAVGRFDEKGELVQVHGFMIDETERRQAEDRLAQSQKMEAIGHLAGGVAHDFNNLLGVILGYCELLHRDAGAGPLVRQRLEQIQRAANAAAGMTRQLLAFSRKQVLEPRVVELNHIVLEVEPMLRRLIPENVQIATRLAGDLGRVKVDPGQIEQVIVNLAVNARDAMPEGGVLTIETSNVELEEPSTGDPPGMRPGRQVLLAVRDTGCGMDAEILTHIFEPFFTTKEVGKGTGLGLATVYGIVKQSGGSVFAYSEPGRGACFKVYLPRVDEPVAPVDAAARGRPALQDLRGTETVLLIEDDAALRAVVREFLVDAGYRVLDCGLPEDALALAQRHAAPIHLLLTDVVMPRLSGPAVAEGLRRRHPGLRVLYMSGYTDSAIVQHGELAPDAQLIAKPFAADALLRRVRQVLE